VFDKLRRKNETTEQKESRSTRLHSPDGIEMTILGQLAIAPSN